jgi:predicted nucleic acid-binding protein
VTVLVDSDVLIEVSRAKDSTLLARWTKLSESDDIVLCSPVSIAELWQGARPSEHEALTNLFRALLCVPLDAESGRQAGEYLRQYRKSHGVELGDALIASAAVMHGAALWTRNREHYPMKGLTFY